jgi:hypothetical protein
MRPIAPIFPLPALTVAPAPVRAASAPAEPRDSYAPGPRDCPPPDSGQRITWGRKGHELVNEEAARALPPDMPTFFAENSARLAVLGSQPDRWKVRSLPHLRNSTSPDHYLDYEIVRDQPLPGDRYAYVRQLAQENRPGTPADTQFNGTLPYRIAELYENLVAELALYRRESQRSGPDSAATRQFQENALYTAGLLGHYIADAVQPLHASVHHDGWNETVEPNPDGYRTTPGIHFQFETLLVNHVDPLEVRRLIPPPALYSGDPLELGWSLVQESNALVRPLYRLEKEGKLDPASPAGEGIQLATARLARGAQVLRDLWYSAWVRSQSVAEEMRDPSAQGDYLLAP